MMSLKNSVAFSKAVLAAGFALEDSKSIETHDGAGWWATLAKGETQLVTVSNGGCGGPDDFRYPENSEIAGADINILMAEFYALPVIIDFARQDAIRGVGLDLKYNEMQQADADIKKTAIMASIPVVNEDVLGFIVAQLADTKNLVSTLKRKNKVNLSWILKGTDDDSYSSVMWPDSPENRSRISLKYDVDVFIGDLIEGL